MTSSTSERTITKARAKAELSRLSDRAFVVQSMSTPAGRGWFWRQLEFAQVFQGTDNLDPHSMAFEKGRRNTGLKLLAELLDWCPHSFVTMLGENSSVKVQPQSQEEQDD